MSAAFMALACVTVSLFGIGTLAFSDPKRLRRRGRAPMRPWRITGLVLTFAPGLWLAGTGQGAAFLLWVGASAVLGWGIAALFGRHSLSRGSDP